MRSLLLTALVLLAAPLAAQTVYEHLGAFGTDISSPSTVLQLADGRILITEPTNTISAFDPDGTRLGIFSNRPSTSIRSLEQLEDGRILVAAGSIFIDTYLPDGTFLGPFVSGESLPGGAVAIEELQDGRILVSAQESFGQLSDVVILNQEGRITGTFVSDLQYPADILQLADDRVLIVEAGHGRIDEYDPDGTVLGRFRGNYRGNIWLEELSGGRILISDTHEDTVEQVAQNGGLRGPFGSGFVDPLSPIELADGRVLVLERNREIEVYAPEGFPPPEDVTLTLLQPASDPSLDCTRQKFTVNVSLQNAGASPADVQVWAVGVQTEGGSFGPKVVRGPFDLTVPAGGNVSKTWKQTVPRTNADRAFDYIVYAGDFSAGNPKLGDGAFASETVEVSQTCGASAKGAHEPLSMLLDDADTSVHDAPGTVSVRPNPFRDRATVTFALEAPTSVRLTLHDVLGREVAVLADGPHEPGEHRVEIAADLPAGVYVWRLVAGDRAESGRVTRVE